MFYYSYFINENSPVKKPSVDDYKMLYNYLPLDVPYVVANDRQHAAEINNYLVPTKSAIKLYAKTPISDKNLIDELSFDGGYIINGSIRKIDKTNLSYIEPHKLIIKDTTFLVFNYSTDIYIGNLNKKIKLVELEDYIKNLLNT